MKLLAETYPALLPTAVVLLLTALAASAAGAEPRPAGTYQPSWESLTKHKVPQWLIDAKFGIYAHWGVYSVPAFGNEWYAKRMYDRNDKGGVYAHHVKTYGDPSKFGYKDLIPLFKAEKFDPDAWADVIARSGARYAGIAVVHHDGFGLWDSQVNRWNAGKMGPKRDLYGELARSLRGRDLKVIATFHHIRTFGWYLPTDPKAVAEGKKAGWDLFDPNHADLYWNEHTGKFEDFIAQWQAKVREVIDKYQPDVLWFDGGKFQEAASQGIALSVLSYYYNAAARAGREVDVLNKLPTTMKFNFPREFGVLTFEAGRDRPDVVDRPWIDDERIGNQSWGYVEGLTYRSADEIVDGLVDRVSRGGGLLLSLSPKADGTIPREQQEILLAMGRWLAANGEAIYGTTTWKVPAEGPVAKLRIDRGAHRSWSFARCDAGDIRFTRKGNTLYAIALGWPADGKLTVRSLGSGARIATGPIRAVTLLGSEEKVSWEHRDEGLALQLPARRPNDFAYAFRIDVEGKLDAGAE